MFLSIDCVGLSVRGELKPYDFKMSIFPIWCLLFGVKVLVKTYILSGRNELIKFVVLTLLFIRNSWESNESWPHIVHAHTFLPTVFGLFLKLSYLNYQSTQAMNPCSVAIIAHWHWLHRLMRPPLAERPGERAWTDQCNGKGGRSRVSVACFGATIRRSENHLPINHAICRPNKQCNLHTSLYNSFSNVWNAVEMWTLWIHLERWTLSVPINGY